MYSVFTYIYAYVYTHTQTHTFSCIHMFICVYIWRFCGVSVHLLNTYLLNTSFGHCIKVGDYSMVCMILPCGAYRPWVGDRSKQSKQNNYKLLCGKCFKENKQDTELEERGHCGQGSGRGRPWGRVSAVCFISDLYQYLMLRISVICTGILTVFIFKILFLWCC